jgi:hypothetical protein
MSVEFALEIEAVAVEVFKPVISVTELWMKTLENTTKDFGARVTQALAEKYGFSNEEAVKFLGLESVAVNRKAMAKRSKSTKEPKEKAKKEKAPKVEKVRLPFTGACDATLCQAVAYNHGLFTQCEKKPLENHSYCVKCQAQADQNASGKPDCGNMEDRLASPMYDYKDNKGRSPVAYTKIMKKYGYTKEQVEAEFAKLNGDAELNALFFEEPEKKKNTGRPKKEAVSTETVSDLFDTLTADNGEEMGADQVVASPSKKAKLTEEEKAAKKAKLEEERAVKKAEREAKEATEKAERAEKRKQELADKKAEREAKKAEEKAKKDAEKAEEKAKKDAEKAEKAKAEKEAKKAEKEAKKTASPVVSKPKEEETKTEEKPVEEEKPKKKSMAVKKMVINEVTYYMNSETKVLYDPKTKEEVGTYDEANKKMIPLPTEEDEEIQSDTYESSSESEDESE